MNYIYIFLILFSLVCDPEHVEVQMGPFDTFDGRTSFDEVLKQGIARNGEQRLGKVKWERAKSCSLLGTSHEDDSL